MLELPDQVSLYDTDNACVCDATIVILDRTLAQLAVDAAWWQIGGSKSLRKNEGDHKWKWTAIVGESRSDPFFEACAVQTPDGGVQGAMSYFTNGISLLEMGQSSVFVAHIATAPRNRFWLVDSPKYRGVGSVLLFRAVCHSWILGLLGRVTLVSLPDERTRNFYERRSFTQISAEADGTIEYELEPDAAERWLRERGFLT